MSETRSPVDQVLDLFVFAPLGLAITAREELPKLIERGRAQTDSQVALARMLGQMAVGRGQQEARRAMDGIWARIGGGSGAHDEPTVGPPVAAPPRPPAAAPPRPPTAAPPAPPAPPAEPAASAEGLAIPGYDALSAPQVVQRLNGLSPAELDAVRSYESATRGRQTILARIAQLQSDPS